MRALTRLGRRPSRSRRPRPLSRPVQRAPAGESHEAFITPRWKQTIGSTIHCLAGDATGIIAAAAITGSLALPLGVDLIIEYAAGFTIGLLIFQALFTKAMKGGSYLAAVRATILPEWLSMNALMAGMIPVMVVLTTQDPSAMEPTSGRFWASWPSPRSLAGCSPTR